MLQRAFLAVDKKVELLYSILLNTSWRDIGVMKRDYSYKLRLIEFSKAFKEHDAFAVRLSEPLNITLVKPPTEDLVERAGALDVLIEFAEKIKKVLL